MLNLNIFEGSPVVKIGFDLETAGLVGEDEHDEMNNRHQKYQVLTVE